MNYIWLDGFAFTFAILCRPDRISVGEFGSEFADSYQEVIEAINVRINRCRGNQEGKVGQASESGGASLGPVARTD